MKNDPRSCERCLRNFNFMQLRILHTATAVSHSRLSREHTFSSFINVLILLCVIFLTYTLSVTVLTWWVASPKMFCNWYRI